MALTNNTLPSVLPSRAVPFDALLAFGVSQTITATGYMQDATPATVRIDIGPGRIDGYWVFDVTALKVSATDETYALWLLGSNTTAFTNGTVEQIASYDFAALAANRRIATIMPASNTMPPTGLTAGRFVIPYTNRIGEFLFRYLQMYLVLGGTSPSITLVSWLTYDTSGC